MFIIAYIFVHYCKYFCSLLHTYVFACICLVINFILVRTCVWGDRFSFSKVKLLSNRLEIQNVKERCLLEKSNSNSRFNLRNALKPYALCNLVTRNQSPRFKEKYFQFLSINILIFRLFISWSVGNKCTA